MTDTSALIIKEALREFVGDGDGADEAVLDEYTRQIQAQALEPFLDLRSRVASTPFEALTRDSMVRSLDAELRAARLTGEPTP